MAVYSRQPDTLSLAGPQIRRAFPLGMIPSLSLFWHSTHRVGRLGFVLACAVLIALRAGTDGWAQHGLPVWLAMPIMLALGYSAMCVLSLRLHDRGRSGWWGWVVLILFAMVWPLAHKAVPDVARIGAAILLVPVFVDLALMPGQKSLNRHGPPPSQPAMFPPAP